MLKACYPLEDKQACMIKQSGTFVPRIKYPNTPSAFETLPVKGMLQFIYTSVSSIVYTVEENFYASSLTACYSKQIIHFIYHSDNAGGNKTREAC